MDKKIRDECVQLSFQRIWRSIKVLWTEMSWQVIDYKDYSHSYDGRMPYRRGLGT
jgi:hypothetical protein